MATILNDDVLYEICRACPASTLVKLSLVSTTFYTMAMPNLLRNVEFYRDLVMLLRFIHFILHNSTVVSEIPGQQVGGMQRFSIANPGNHVYKFEMDLGRENDEADTSSDCPIEEWAPLLTKAMMVMPNLRSVAILDFRRICCYSSQFVEALLSRLHLTSFEVDGIDATASRDVGEIVKSKRCEALRLKYIGFNDWFTFDDWEDAAFFKDDGFGSLIYSCRKTLERLAFDDCNMRNLLVGPQVLPDGSTKPIIYPLVDKIHLSGHLHVTVEEFALSFPSLRSLHLGNSSFVQQNSGQDRKVPFRNLVSVDTDLGILPSFLECIEPLPSLRRLTVSGFWRGHSNGGFSATRSVLTVFQNLRSIHVRIDRIADVDPWIAMSKHLSSLRYLNLDYRFEPDENQQILNIINPERLSSIPVEYISLAYTLRRHTPEDENLVSDEIAALLYARKIKSLRFIDVSKKFYRKNLDVGCLVQFIETHWWKINRRVSSDDVENVELENLRETTGAMARDTYDESELGIPKECWHEF